MTAPSRSVECKAARATLEEATNEIVVSVASIYEIGNKARLGCKAGQVVRGRVLPQLHILLWKKRGAWSLGGMEKEMTQKTTLYSSLTQLGRSTPLPKSPETAELEKVANPHDGTPYCVRFSAPEFTSLCPVTGQPDFAHLVIDYVPGKWLLESKSLKLYLGSFRDHRAFHEECTVSIGRRLVDLLAPEWLRIGGYWYPRGGIPIDVFYQTGPVPQNIWVPDQGVPPYRGRG